MKNVLASLLVLATGSAALAAGQLYVDGRADHVSYSPNDAVGKPGYEAWQLSRFKIDYQDKMSDANSFRVRLDGLQNTAAANTRDKASKFMDLAFVTHKFTDMVSVSVGKIATGIGGVEGFINTPGDIYLLSIAGAEDSAVYYPTGAQADLTFGDNKVRLNFANNTTDVTTTVGGTAYLSQTRGLMGVTYLGKFMDNNLLLTANYHMEDYVTTANVKAKDSYAGIGGKFVMDAFEFEADYLMNKYDLDPQAAANTLATNSAIVLVRYKIDELGSVHIKYENTDQKVATSTTDNTKNKYNGYTAAFEYKPVKDENWRMHVAFTQRDKKPETGDTQTEKFVYAGMRFYADFLK